MSAPQTLSELRRWAASAPAGTNIPVASLAEMLADFDELSRRRDKPEEPSDATQGPSSWRERLWTVPAETRLGVHELAEALDRPKSWIYRRTGEKAEDRLPHRKQGGELVFLAGEVRTWVRDNEETLYAMASTPAERRLRAM